MLNFSLIRRLPWREIYRARGSWRFVVVSKWQVSPRISFLSNVPSWLASVVLLLSNVTVSCDRSQEICSSGLLVFTFPAEEFRLMSGVLKPDYSMMKTTVTCNKIKQSTYEESVKSVTGTKILSHAV